MFTHPLSHPFILDYFSFMVKVPCQELNNKLLLSAKLVDMAKARSKGVQARLSGRMPRCQMAMTRSKGVQAHRSGRMPRCQQSVPGHAMKAVCHRRCMHARKNVSHSTLISKWLEVVSEVAGKARGMANRPRDPLIARGVPPSSFVFPWTF